MEYLQTMKEKLTLNGKGYRQIMPMQKLHFVRTIKNFFSRTQRNNSNKPKGKASHLTIDKTWSLLYKLNEAWHLAKILIDSKFWCWKFHSNNFVSLPLIRSYMKTRPFSFMFLMFFEFWWKKMFMIMQFMQISSNQQLDMYFWNIVGGFSTLFSNIQPNFILAACIVFR